MTIELPAVARAGVPILGQPKPPPARPLRVHGWLGDEGGCAHYRIMLPLSHLPLDRWLATADRQIDLDWWNRHDIVIGQRVSKPGTSNTWQRICADPTTFAIYELDDDLLNVDRSNPVHGYFSRPDIRAMLETNIAAANRVIVSTAELADTIRPINPDVVVVPNTIDATVLDLPRPDQADAMVTVGWAGSDTHAADWREAAPHVARLVADDPAVRVAFAGACYPPGIPRDRVSWSPWQPDITRHYRHVAMTFDIGLAPLAHTPFNAAKSHIKALEYAAAGIPVIASAEPPYEQFVRHGETGFLVRQPHEWSVHLRKLVGDRDLRTAMGDAARVHAASWTIQQHIGLWEEALTP